MGVNSLPKTVTRQHRNCDLNPGPSAPESSTLTTRLPSHPMCSTHRGAITLWDPWDAYPPTLAIVGTKCTGTKCIWSPSTSATVFVICVGHCGKLNLRTRRKEKYGSKWVKRGWGNNGMPRRDRVENFNLIGHRYPPVTTHKTTNRNNSAVTAICPRPMSPFLSIFSL